MQDQTLVERDKAEHDASWYVPDLYAKKNNNRLFSFSLYHPLLPTIFHRVSGKLPIWIKQR